MGVKAVYVRCRDLFFKWRGYNLLSREHTTDKMLLSQVKTLTSEDIVLPQVLNCADNSNSIFREKTVCADVVYVWDYSSGDKKAIQLSRYGSVIISKNVLCTDWNHGSIYKKAWKIADRPARSLPVVIAVFSHFRDGIFYGGYYDFVFLVLTKLARIKEAMPEADFLTMPIAYPLFNTSYEKDYLELLGMDTACLTDTTKYKITARRVLTGNSSRWYPNIEDILVLKRLVAQRFIPAKTSVNRVYISRGERRCITNEEELVALLKTFGFTIIEDKPRSVAEQITIYHSADFIIGPHGASFSNIIWCRPGTHLFELFSPNYTPDFFLYLATVMDMKYFAFYGGAPDPAVDYLDGLTEDITVPVARLKECLEAVLKGEMVQ